MSNLLIESIIRGYQLGLGFVFMGGAIYAYIVRMSPPTDTPVASTSPNPTVVLSPAAQFVETSTPYFILLFLASAILLGLGFCVVAIAAMVEAWGIHRASRRYPGEPWRWRAAWRRDTLPTTEPEMVSRLFWGLGFLLLGAGLLSVAILGPIESLSIGSVLGSLFMAAITTVVFLFSWAHLRNIFEQAAWRRRLTPRLVAIPTKPGETLAVEFTYDPRFTPTEGFRVRLMNRSRGFTEVEATVEQSPGRIPLRCDTIDGEFIADPYVQRCEWQVWLGDPRIFFQYAVPVFALSSNNENTVSA